MKNKSSKEYRERDEMNVHLGSKRGLSVIWRGTSSINSVLVYDDNGQLKGFRLSMEYSNFQKQL